MTRPMTMVGIWLLGAGLGWGQAGGPPSASPKFSLGTLCLREPVRECPIAATAKPSERDAIAAELMAAARTRELEIEGKFERAVVSTVPRRLSRTGADRFFCDVFEPEPVRLGKLTVATSVTTAIKRRNPLCLLNPYVIQVGW